MAMVGIDAQGLRSPLYLIKMAAYVPRMREGDIMEVTGNSSTFEQDVRAWCERMNKELISAQDCGAGKRVIQIRF